MQAWYVRAAERQQFVDVTLMPLIQSRKDPSESLETFAIRLHMAILAQYQGRLLRASDASLSLASGPLLREINERISLFARGDEENLLLLEMVRERLDNPTSRWVRSAYEQAESADPQRFLMTQKRETHVAA